MAYPTLQDLSTAAVECRSCGLCEGRTQVVPGEGSSKAEILFLGEGPGFNEDKQGRPFVGQAGKLLDEMLGVVGVQRQDVFITNVVKCRPPGNRDPLPQEIEACKPWLMQQLELLQPKLIVTLGRHAMAMFLPGDTITRAHGIARKAGRYLVMPMYHPAAALYQVSLKKTLEDDFKKIPALLKELARPAAVAQPATPKVQPATEQSDGPKQLTLL